MFVGQRLVNILASHDVSLQFNSKKETLVKAVAASIALTYVIFGISPY